MKANATRQDKGFTRRSFAREIWRNLTRKYKPIEEPIAGPEDLARRERVREISAELSKQAGIRAPRIFFEDAWETVKVMNAIGRARIRVNCSLAYENERFIRGVLVHEFWHVKKMQNLKNFALVFALMTNFDEKPGCWQAGLLSAVAKKQEYGADLFSAQMNGMDVMVETLQRQCETRSPHIGGLFAPSLHERLERLMKTKEEMESR